MHQCTLLRTLLLVLPLAVLCIYPRSLQYILPRTLNGFLLRILQRAAWYSKARQPTLTTNPCHHTTLPLAAPPRIPTDCKTAAIVGDLRFRILGDDPISTGKRFIKALKPQQPYWRKPGCGAYARLDGYGDFCVVSEDTSVSLRNRRFGLYPLEGSAIHLQTTNSLTLSNNKPHLTKYACKLCDTCMLGVFLSRRASARSSASYTYRTPNYGANGNMATTKSHTCAGSGRYSKAANTTHPVLGNIPTQDI